MKSAEQLRCGTKVRTKNGWFNVVRVWIRGGKTSKVDLSVNGREIPSVDAEELCKHILEVDVI
jgi:hypothetical protein